MKSRIAVPVIEGIAAAVKQAELLVALDARKAIAGTCRRPDPKASSGLAPSLAALLAGSFVPINGSRP